MKRPRLLFVVTLGVVGLLAGAIAFAQPVAPFYVGLITPGISQSTLRVNTVVTPNRTEIGCEGDRIAGTTVNCLRIVGAATGTNASIAPLAATGGDANRGVDLRALGTGSNNIGCNATLVNCVNVQGNATGTAAVISASSPDSDANVGVDLNGKGTGAVRIGFAVGTRVEFYPAITYCRADSANILTTRLAANDWALTRTAAGAETYIINCVLPLPWRTTASKGARLDSFRVSQQVTVAALTSNTFNALSTTTYVNNVANAVAAYGGTITVTMPTATQAAPYLTAATVGTPAYMTTVDAQVSLEFTVVMANTGVYRFYGISATFTQALY
mgnify:CR=1 FL=1